MAVLQPPEEQAEESIRPGDDIDDGTRGPQPGFNIDDDEPEG